MAPLHFSDSHNMLACLKKVHGAPEFHDIVDFLRGSHISYALQVSPTIYTDHITAFWVHATLRVESDEKQIVGKVEGHDVVVTEKSIRQHLHLADGDGMDSVPNAIIFENLKLMGYEGDLNKLTFSKSLFSPPWKFLIHTLLQCMSQKRTAWNEFSSSIASAMVCLALNQTFNFSKLIFDGMLWNLEHEDKIFLMYPRFLQHIVNNTISPLSKPKEIYICPVHGQKVFSNMKRVNKGFSGMVTPLFATMVQPVSQGEEADLPSASQPPPSKRQKVLATYVRRNPRVSPPSGSQPIDAEEMVNEELRDHVGRAGPTVEEQDRSNITKTQTTATLNAEIPSGIDAGSGPRCQDTTGDVSAQARPESTSVPVHDAPLTGVNTPGSAETSMQIKELTAICTTFAQSFSQLFQIVQNQEKEIATLKRLVNKSVQKRKVHKFKLKEYKRLKRPGTSQVVSSSTDDDVIMVDAPKEGEGKDTSHTLNEDIEETGEVADECLIENEILTTAEMLISLQTTGALPKVVQQQSTTKGVTIQEPAVVRQEIPRISASDKGKGILIEQERPLKRKLQMQIDAEMARKLAEEEAQAQALEKANQPDLEADAVLAAQLQAEEQAQYSEEQRAELLQELLTERKKAEAKKRAKAQRERPLTKAQLKAYMTKFLKHQGYQVNNLKGISFEELESAYQTEKKKLADFLDVTAEKPESEPTARGEEKEEEKEEKEEEKEEEVQEIPQQAELEQEYSEHTEIPAMANLPEAGNRTLMIIPKKAAVIDVVPLATKRPMIINWRSEPEGKYVWCRLTRADGSSEKYTSTKRMIKSLTRDDLEDMYRIGERMYADTPPSDTENKVTWVMLQTMFDPSKVPDIWISTSMDIIRWELFENNGVHFIRFRDFQLFLLVERCYPLRFGVICQLLKTKLQPNADSAMAADLLNLLAKQVFDYGHSI